MELVLDSYSLMAFFQDEPGAEKVSALLAEAALSRKLKNQTLIDLLYFLYEKFGIFLEETLSISLPEGMEGKKQLDSLMEKWRKNPPLQLGGLDVLSIEDYQKQRGYDFLTKKEFPLSLPISNVLLFHLQNKGKVVIRPSGTEPKIKIYFEAHEKDFATVEEGLKKCKEQMNILIQDVKEKLHN